MRPAKHCAERPLKLRVSASFMPSGIKELVEQLTCGSIPVPWMFMWLSNFGTAIGVCRDCAENHDAQCRNVQELRPADTAPEANGGVGLGPDHFDALVGRRPPGLETSPSKEDLWLRNPNSYTSLHLDPRQDVQVRHQMTLLCWCFLIVEDKAGHDHNRH